MTGNPQGLPRGRSAQGSVRCEPAPLLAGVLAGEWGPLMDIDEREQQPPLRHSRPAPVFRILCFSRSSGFLSKYFGFRLQPIFEVVTVFTAPFLVKPIRTYTN